ELVIQRQELEQMNLLETYRDTSDTLHLKQPLKSKDFLQHAMFGRLYSIVSGQDALKKMVLKHVRQEKLIEGENISKRFDSNRLAIWDEQLEKEFAKQDAAIENENPQTPTIQKPKGKTPKKRFDVEIFFDSIPNIVYPEEFRTPQLKRLIEEVGTLFEVDFDTMKRFMINSSNFETKKFDTKKFVYLLEEEFGRMEVDEKNPYDVDPVSFIRHKQGYEYVVGSDQNLVKSLTENFGFNHQVINFLVEYVLEINNNNLNRSYVEKIASTWKRNGVETLEDARKQIQPKTKKKKQVKQTQEMPEYSQDESMSEKDEAVLRESIEQMLREAD
ncbi:MAG TPA: DnaD domain protein, partial [Erysipelothrix sp.]|nr:DnaD domain protein [Erysipelothrix sp.]